MSSRFLHRLCGVATALMAVAGLVAEPADLHAEAQADRVVVRVNGARFTEYLFGPDTKYPYFFPVNGPRSGRSITAHKTEPYPHHSSVFFGCDRVNGGNYWQEGLDRGRIAGKTLRLVRDRGGRIEFEQDCVWERPGGESPFADHRRIVITAPDSDVRLIDFEVTLTARAEVKIEKTNHSLFAVRVAPEISVKEGGTLVNAHGGRGETGTFGKPAPWADYRGTRDGVTEGIALFSHPQNRWYPEPWFTRDYGFMSPTPMEWLEGGSLTISQGERLHLRYRVVVHAGAPDAAQLERWFAEWSRQ